MTDVHNIVLLLKGIRRNRPAERLHSSHFELTEMRGLLAQIPAFNTPDADNTPAEQAVSAIRTAIANVGDVDDLDSTTVQTILARILDHSSKRTDARNFLADAFGNSHHLSERKLRDDNGIEDKCIAALADLIDAQTPTSDAHSSVVDISELYFGLVLWLGTDAEKVQRRLENLLTEAGYQVQVIKLSSLLSELPDTAVMKVPSKSSDLIGYLSERMDAGDNARSIDPAIMAELAIENIATRRRTLSDTFRSHHGRGIAYILDSLMHPAEVELLRQTYGSLFFLIAIHEDESGRFNNLMEEPGLAAWKHAEPDGDASAEVRALISRNRGAQGRGLLAEPRPPHALSVQQVFHLADVFVDVRNPALSQQARSQSGETQGLTDFTIDQFIAQIFSNPYNVPTKHERGMAHAYVAASGSASLGRRVGAAIMTRDGELISVGMNEVPAPHGGQYPLPKGSDHRDHTIHLATVDAVSAVPKELEAGASVDANDSSKLELLRDLLIGLHQMGVLKPTDGQLFQHEISYEDSEQVASQLIDDHPELGRARLFDVIEFGRSVHAEMAALLNALRRGQKVDGAIVYCTTFPCHECSRHLIMAGIHRVVYVEPYPKSRVFDLHDDATHHGNGPTSSPKLQFVPFIGIAPDRHGVLYSDLPRKQSMGVGVTELITWQLSKAQLRDQVAPTDAAQRWLQNSTRSALEARIFELLSVHRGESE